MAGSRFVNKPDKIAECHLRFVRNIHTYNFAPAVRAEGKSILLSLILERIVRNNAAPTS